MNPVLARARSLNRRIYASLPWGYRVAHLILRVASGYIDVFGRVVLAEFIKSGVEGLPPINGEPALAYQDKVQGPRGPDRLPKGSGKAFGQKVYATLMAKVRNVEVVEEALSRVMLDFARGKVRIEQGSPLPKAEAFIFHLVKNAVVDLSREQRSRPQGDMLLDEDGGTIDFEDPNTFRHFDQMLPRSEMSSFLRELEKVHPKAVPWLEAKLEGLSSREIADEWGVSPPRVNQIENAFMPKLRALLQEYIQAAA